MKVSPITGLEYRPLDCVFYRNPVQAHRFMKHGAVLYDLIVGDDGFTWVFNREATRGLNDLWCRHELA